MKAWPRKPLAEVATVGSGAGFPIVYQGTFDEAFPFLKVSDMNLEGNARTIQRWNNTVSEEVRARLRATAFPAGSLIFPKIGAAIATNKKRLLIRACCADNNVMGIVPDFERLDSDYLYYLFLTKNLSDFASDSNPPSIRKTVVEAWSISVPPLAEQRRIVDLLSRAEGIVRLRREAQKKAQAIIPALFFDMFGDPATNPKGWPISRLGDIADVVSGITKGRKLNGKLTTPVPYLRVANVQSGFLDLAEMKEIEATLAEIEALKLNAGDIVLTEGGDYDKLGRGAQWRGQVEACIHQNHVFRVRMHPEAAAPDYFEAYLQTQAAVRYFLSVAKRTTNLASINMTQLRNLPVTLPPLANQRAFVARAGQVRSINLQQQTASAAAQSTFNALLARMFSYESREQRDTEAVSRLEGTAIA